ncbi:MAG: prepilin-type N-terminal cleavage/methylation domain-containing protein [Candidatus Dadabacteria bacterium]|nr:MAG: prepilin-type N-terminal cleavage/methylation domain-containing protein [Candidatus Dadabacteria bacterium]
MKRPAGFTLLEVLIATSIAAAAIVGVLELFSGSSHLARASVRQTDAMLLAQSLLDRAIWRSDLDEVPDGGERGPSRWTIEVEPYEPRLGHPEGAPSRENESELYELRRVRVTVEWGPPADPRAIELATVRLMERF